ncbi:UDP-N-acetylmuramoyl-L-alanyl-D-glutamate--2,6-diaminopimelate ligase [Gardnerella greenwoodii]|uniref:UDP-N-acetylmuramoylalanyl-D-glutamate--2, 6-diaminopimelate ligase n=2 Tax=Gardnerella greenwoodii TaxID=2914925 RepID=I4M985_9BIFI|nr:UDP-N-acetylmuramoyl-L-alanyl-D-glutamate--2,6-diaminopimelate ligase [Gardnerella greenwoodii]EIK85775.1 UDP-N-acetylmuramoylalanyl-D-glutamate--2,6-diaminopimelate ligase [Gardnerella greenwoodii 00703Dmash]MDF0753398.1 UDP-N-acetylmuramoyl-L-alanyl-D-glutamate--2,6-diaminopimelate ligase [Gardnerella greenwoodii]PMC43121.1 UDP-N-acetylmuramoyl-L-alanyl-D-glutamate--2,6-diaminopimelate ligase [Gardnerella greenwoodii]
MTMHNTLSLTSASKLLQQYGLLREMIQHHESQDLASNSEQSTDSTHSRNEIWSLNPYYFANVDADECFAHATYDTRDIKPGTLLFIKGNFKPEYLLDADSKGLSAYVAEQSYAEYTNAVGLIVTDVRKAMSILSAAFFGNPQEKLTVVGITGTKGKTTTAYFTHAILNAHSGSKAALFSSVDNCLDGVNYVESDLTTPESFDAFKMMREAVDNGMKYLVMEVSSQAYKVNRVYGLKFDVAAFLNISPDHISPIEHPTFEDYLYCKRQIIANTKRLVLNADADHADLLLQDAERNNVPVATFARIQKDEIENSTCEVINSDDLEDNHTDYCASVNDDDYSELLTPDYIAIPAENSESHCISIRDTDENSNDEDVHYSTVDDFSLAIAGDFNYENALAAIAIAGELSINQETDLAALKSIENIKIPGRMEVFKDAQSSTIAVVDYAHNYISTKALLDFVDERFGKENPRITLVTGSAGNKAYDRRKEIVQAAQNRIYQFIFTTEDTNTEDEMDICKDMRGYITNENVKSHIIIDRPDAVEYSVDDARKSFNREEKFNVILLIGKGDERWIKHENKHVPYEGDSEIIKRLFTL